MKIELKPWTLEDKKDLAQLCHNADRRFLSDRLPYPYTEDNAQWWIGMAEKQEGKEGIFRAILADGKIVGNISVEKKADVYRRDGEIGYMLKRSALWPIKSWILSVSPDWSMSPILLPERCWKRMDLSWKAL